MLEAHKKTITPALQILTGIQSLDRQLKIKLLQVTRLGMSTDSNLPYFFTQKVLKISKYLHMVQNQTNERDQALCCLNDVELFFF